MRLIRPAAILALVAAVALGACAKKEPPPPPPAPTPAPPPTATPVAAFKVTSIDVGKSIGDDKKLKEAAAVFGPKETVYVVILTEGVASKATLKARWTYGEKGTLVNEETRDIAPNGPAATEFHIAKPSGWPAGKYKVEVSADGAPVGAKEFEVKK